MVDFTITSKPSHIEFLCPSCKCRQRIDWRELNPPEYWGDYWGEVSCPTCDALIELEDWVYD